MQILKANDKWGDHSLNTTKAKFVSIICVEIRCRTFSFIFDLFQELREQARQYQMPIPIRTVRGSQNSAMRGHGDTLCSSCGQPLTSISIRLRAVMRSRQALKNTFRRQFALIIQQRDELRTRAREAEAKGRILERRHILMKAQVRAVHEAYLRDIQLGNLSNP